jgi:hypothetical protein
MPALKSKLPRIDAPIRDALPLGIGRSGLSIASISASNTSLKIIPPPYRPVVARSNHASGIKLEEDEEIGSSGDTEIRTAHPEAANPAKISAHAVTILAGRIN